MRRPNDPVLGYRFVLELGFMQVAGFSECTGLSQETKIMEYKEGGRNGSPLKFPDVGGAGNITLKRGIVPGDGVDALFRWQADVRLGEFNPDNNPNKRKASAEEDIDQRCAVVLQDEAGNEVMRWRLVRAFPVKWVGPDLKGATGDLAMETLELACEGLEPG